MSAARYLTLLWPGLPWLWLRGSLTGLVVAVAFAVTLDVALITTCIWSGLVDLPFTIAIWTAAAALWVLATASALAAFPPPLQRGRDATGDELFLQARNAYLARDWLTAEQRLEAVLSRSPTDGEAQLLLATLLRRVGRPHESREALEKLSRSDAGLPWGVEIARERALLATAGTPAEADETPAVLPWPAKSPGMGDREIAA